MPLRRRLTFIFGYHIFECDASNTEKLLNIFMRYRIIYWGLQKNEEKCVFRVLSKDAENLISLCGAERIELRLLLVRGLFHILGRYKKRAGLFVGAIVFAATVYISGLFVWEINITGKTSVPRREITELLAAHGLEVGSYIPSLDLDAIKNRALIDSDTLSWMAVNINGTSVNIVVREIEGESEETAKKSPANLVAICDGQIEMLEVYEGQPTVNVGDAVRAGELLVSGIVGTDITDPRYLHAQGKIWARTTKTVRVEIPLEYEKKVYTGEVKRQKTIKFFAKNINLFINSGNLSENYDKIEREDPLTFFGRFTVPVSILTEEYREYTYQTFNRTETEAVKLAYAELSLAVNDALRGAELLKKTVTAGFSDQSYVIECELYCIEDIATVAEFEINEGIK